MLAATTATHKLQKLRSKDGLAMISVASRGLIRQRASLVPLPLPLNLVQAESRAINLALPVSLHYYIPHLTSGLFEKQKDSHSYSLQVEVVNMAKDGLVYPSVVEARRSSHVCYFECIS